MYIPVVTWELIGNLQFNNCPYEHIQTVSPPLSQESFSTSSHLPLLVKHPLEWNGFPTFLRKLVGSLFHYLVESTSYPLRFWDPRRMSGEPSEPLQGHYQTGQYMLIWHVLFFLNVIWQINPIKNYDYVYIAPPTKEVEFNSPCLECGLLFVTYSKEQFMVRVGGISLRWRNLVVASSARQSGSVSAVVSHVIAHVLDETWEEGHFTSVVFS